MEGTKPNPRIFILVVLLVGIFATMAFFSGVHTGRNECKPARIELEKQKAYNDELRRKCERDLQALIDSNNVKSLNRFLLKNSIDDI